MKPQSAPPPSEEPFATFGEVLTYLRKRARLTQEELGRAVGYSRAQITRLEKNQRAPDLLTLRARFLPVLAVEDAPDLADQLVRLATRSRAIARFPIPPAAPPVTLPAPLLPLLGRAAEMRALDVSLRDPAVRLLSLVGPPGVGKSRLALEVAHGLAPRFAHGALRVELSAVASGAQLPAMLRHALGLPDPPGGLDEAGWLAEALRARSLLLLLDPFEALHESAPFLQALLLAAPALKLLLVSRSALHCYGEHLFLLDPLPTPSCDPVPALAELAVEPAVALFLARARAVRPGLLLSPANAAAIAQICAQLDGLPLALELAAAQMRWLSPEQLAERLTDRLARLEDISPGRPARQQTLRAAIEWSVGRLSGAQQCFFARLAVFEGGFGGAAAAAVGDGTLLPALLDANLVQRLEDVEGEARFRLLATIRACARERLEASGEWEATRQAHARYFLALAGRAEAQLQTSEQPRWMARLAAEQHNFRAALGWALAPDGEGAAQRCALALQLCAALWRFWRYRCLLAEGYQWSCAALAADVAATCHSPLPVRARAAWGAGMLAAVMGRESEAIALIEESLHLWRTVEEPEGIADALTALGAGAMRRGDCARAVALQEEALALYIAQGNPRGQAYAHNALGETLRYAGQPAASRVQYEASLLQSRASGHQRGKAVARANLAGLALDAGEWAAARAGFIAALGQFVASDDRINVATCLMGVACVWAQTDSAAAAARLWSAAERLLDASGGQLEQSDQHAFAPHLATCRAALDDATWQRVWAEGMRLPLEEAVVAAAAAWPPG